jgi:CTP synthase
MGATMRLGSIDVDIVEDTLAYKLYNSSQIRERHRHRYEFNQKYIDQFRTNGMIFSGSSDNGKRMEILEIPSHPFFVAVQYHPEFLSRPGFPEPVFRGLVSAAMNRRKSRIHRPS